MSATDAVSSSGDIQPSPVEMVSAKISNIKYVIGVTPKRKRKYCVQISTDTFSKKTKSLHPSEDNSVSWTEIFSILVTTDTVLTLKVFRNLRLVGSHKLVAVGQRKISILTQEEDVTVNLTPTKSNKQLLPAAPTIGFILTPNNADLVKEANRQVDELHNSNHPRLDAAINADTSIGELIKSLSGHVQTFMTIMETISEIHSYTKLAWSVLSAVPKAIKQQEQVDESVVNLAQQMNNMYELVNRADPLKKVQGNEGQMKVLVSMAQQTLECAYFIREYCTDASLVKRTFRHLGSSAQKSIADYSRTLSELQSAFEAQSVVNIQLSVTRIMDIVDDIVPLIEDKFNMSAVPYAASAGYDPGKKCLEGTREEIIDEICQWASGTEHDKKNVLLLTGFAGAGKSTIAHSVANRFRALGRVGSMFCFDRANVADRYPGNLFRNIARDLADLDVGWRKLLSPHIQTRDAQTTNSPETQFNEFILAPAQGLKNTEEHLAVGPVVIIIDALDESTERVDRGVLLDILSVKTVDLPMNFRIFITSRAEEDIEAAFRDQSHVHRLRMSDIKSADKDIEVFVHNRLGNLSKKSEFDKDDAVRWLTGSAEGLFQWASTACRFIEGGPGTDPADRLEKLKLAVSQHKALTHLNTLEKLYSSVLSGTFLPENEDGEERLRTVMGWILAAREPLSKSSLRDIGRANAKSKAVDLVLPFLGSLFSGIDDEDLPIVPLHTSFRDFLQKHYRQNIVQRHREFTIWALQVMMDNIHISIDDLKSSQIIDTIDLKENVKGSSSITLSYVCSFWVYHLSEASYGMDFTRRASAKFHDVLNILGDLVKEAKS